MAESSVIGLLRVLLTADTAEFAPKLRQAGKDVQGLGAEVTKTQGTLNQFGTRAGAVSSVIGKLVPALTAGAVIGLAKSFTNAASEIKDMSDRTGISITEIQRLKFAAEQTGSSLDAFTTAASQLQKRIAGGDQTAAGAIARLGLEMAELRKLDPGAMFTAIADKIGAIEDPAERTRLAFELFGRSGTQLLPAFIEGVGKLGDEAERTGQVMSESLVKSGEELGDNFDKLIGVGKTLIGTALSPLVPLLGLIANGLTAVLGPLTNLLGKFFAFLNPVEQFKIAMGKAREELERWGVLASKVPQVTGDAAKGVEAWRQSVAARAAVPLEDALKNEDAIIAQLSGTLKTNNAAWGTHAKATDEAREAIKRASDELDALHEKLAGKGILTTQGYSKAVGELVEQLNLAAKEGPAALQRALDVLAPDIERLGEEAEASGQDVSRLTSAVKLFQDEAARTGGVSALVDSMIELERAAVRGADALGDVLAVLPQTTMAAEEQALAVEMAKDAYDRFGTEAPQDLGKVRDASEEVGAVWQTSVVPRVTGAVQRIQTAVSGSFAQMALGAKSFKDGFLDVWQSIKAGILNILAEIADAFINSFLKGLLGALTGQQGAFSKAFGGLFGGLKIPGIGGGGGGVPGTGGGVPGMGGVGTFFRTPLGGGLAGAGAGAAVGFGVGRSTGSAAGGAGAGAATGAAVGLLGGPIGALIGGGVGAIFGLFGAQKARKEANNLRDRFLEQYAKGIGEGFASGTGTDSTFMKLAAELTRATGEAGGGTLFKNLMKANDADELAQAIAAVNAKLEEYRAKTGDLAGATAAATEAEKAHKAAIVEKQAALTEQMAALDQQLADIDAREAPEKHMGVREKMERERIAKKKAQIQEELNEQIAALKKLEEQTIKTYDSLVQTSGTALTDIANDANVAATDIWMTFADSARKAQSALDAIDVDPVTVRVKWKIPELPDNLNIPGHALGGVFDRPHLAQIAEGGESEIVGSVEFMTRALRGALATAGGAGGSKVVIVPAFISGEPSADDVEKLVQTLKRAEPAIAGNLGGVRTALRSAVGIR